MLKAIITSRYGPCSVGPTFPVKGLTMRRIVRMRCDSIRAGLIAGAVAATCLNPLPAGAATIIAQSASLIDVRAAVTAAAPGDIVQVPAGNATWTSTLNISRGITLVGAGVGQTIITSGIDDKFSAMLSYAPSLNETFRITGFTFDGAWRSSAIFLSNPSSGVVNQIRIDHNLFRNAIQYAIRMDGEVFGLV